MTKTVTIKSPDGEKMEIEIEELNDLEIIEWATKAPEELKTDPENVKTSPEVVNFLVELVESQTVLNRELIEKMETSQIQRLFNATAAYAFGAEYEPDELEDDEDDDEMVEFDLNEDGAVDLNDWR